MFRSLKFYFKVLRLSARDKNFRTHALEELWHAVRQYLPARLVTRRRDYVFCRYLDTKPSNPPRGRWLPPQALPYRLSAYGMLFDEQGRVLMVSAETLSFSWNLPGGAVNKHETLIEGLKREFEEETGLLVKAGEVVAVADNFVVMPTGRAVHGVLHFYLVEAVGGTLLPEGNGFDTTRASFVDPAILANHQLNEHSIVRNVIRQGQARWALTHPAPKLTPDS